jgi:RHS repeat-associated protein
VDFAIEATLEGQSTQTSVTVLVPPATVSLDYDAAGNLLDDGLRRLTWDAENRLTSVTTKDGLLPPGAPHYRVTYQYDDLGRRIAQSVETRTADHAPWLPARRRAFLFDGWSCVAEFDYTLTESGESLRTLWRSMVWGPGEAAQRRAPFRGHAREFTGHENAGGLVMVRRHSGPQAGTHFATADGNGNLTALTSAATGEPGARYDYDPFGNLLRATGPFAAENPFRFSSQHSDDITGLVYYGYRHYDPLHGRWLSPDPLAEAAGPNLYAFLDNDPLNDIDTLGLAGEEFAGMELPVGDHAVTIYPPGATSLPPITLLATDEGKVFVHVEGGAREYQEITDTIARKFPEIARHLPPLDNSSNCECGDRGQADIQKRLTAQIGSALGRHDRLRQHLAPASGAAWANAEAIVASAIASELSARFIAKLIEFLARARDLRKACQPRPAPAIADDVRIVPEKSAAPASESATRVIGRTGDLIKPGALRPGEKTLEFHFVRRADDTIDQAATWYRNHQALRSAMRQGRPIRDISPDNKLGRFLNAERMQLEYRNWKQQTINGEVWWFPPSP